MDLYDLGSIEGKEELIISFLKVRFLIDQIKSEDRWERTRVAWFRDHRTSVLRYLMQYLTYNKKNVPRGTFRKGAPDSLSQEWSEDGAG